MTAYAAVNSKLFYVTVFPTVPFADMTVSAVCHNICCPERSCIQARASAFLVASVWTGGI